MKISKLSIVISVYNEKGTIQELLKRDEKVKDLKAGFVQLKTNYYSKVFSVKYLLSRLGLNVSNKIFSDISIPVFSGDMFMITARKK